MHTCKNIFMLILNLMHGQGYAVYYFCATKLGKTLDA